MGMRAFLNTPFARGQHIYIKTPNHFIFVSGFPVLYDNNTRRVVSGGVGGGGRDDTRVFYKYKNIYISIERMRRPPRREGEWVSHAFHHYSNLSFIYIHISLWISSSSSSSYTSSIFFLLNLKRENEREMKR